MRKKRILVCGASGFIGHNMADYFASLPEEYEVVGTFLKSEPHQNSQIRWVRADLTRAEDVDLVLTDADIVIQAAAITSGSKDIVKQPYIHVTDNAVMNSLLLRSVYTHSVEQFVFFSCTVMYQSSDIAIGEMDFNPSDELNGNYFGAGWTKVYIERMCEFYSRLGRTKHTVLRHSNIYGPNDKFDLEKSHVLGATMTKVLAAKDRKITVWGNGEEARDLLYISDLIKSVDLAIRKQTTPYELMNIGLGQSITVNELVQRIIEESGDHLDIVHDTSKPSIKTSIYLDCSKAKALLGWAPETSLEEGIRKTMSWCRQKNPDISHFANESE